MIHLQFWKVMVLVQILGSSQKTLEADQLRGKPRKAPPDHMSWTRKYVLRNCNHFWEDSPTVI